MLMDRETIAKATDWIQKNSLWSFIWNFGNDELLPNKRPVDGFAKAMEVRKELGIAMKDCRDFTEDDVWLIVQKLGSSRIEFPR